MRAFSLAKKIGGTQSRSFIPPQVTSASGEHLRQWEYFYKYGGDITIFPLLFYKYQSETLALIIKSGERFTNSPDSITSFYFDEHYAKQGYGER